MRKPSMGRKKILTRRQKMSKGERNELIYIEV